MHCFESKVVNKVVLSNKYKPKLVVTRQVNHQRPCVVMNLYSDFVTPLKIFITICQYWHDLHKFIKLNVFNLVLFSLIRLIVVLVQTICENVEAA